MYKQAAGAQTAGTDGKPGETSGAHKRDGEVVDAEFEDVN
jgi:hypothetical protein